MTQKNLLISSMEKLINHIRKSQANQQQIFYSLSRNDFKKILSNLQDDNALLRKTSLNLIAQLMSSNSKLRRKFCKTMDINLIPGKILFNTKTLQKQVINTNFKILLNLLKKQPDTIQNDCLLWYIHINNKNRQLQIQYIYKDKNNINMQIDLDPQQCIVGFCLSKMDLQLEVSNSNLSLVTTQISQSQKKNQLKNLIEQNPRKIVSYANQKVNSSMSECQPKYQRNTNKNITLQTDRPKKFMNNFLNQRKNASFKGNQTQRHSTLNSQNLNYIQRDSITQGQVLINQRQRLNQRQTFVPKQSLQPQIEIHRSTMPKANQSPYIPTLNLQNTPKNIGYNTDRIGQSYTSTNNRSKQIDFQKIKYQGIKLTSSNSNSRSSYGNYITRNTDRDNTYSGSTGVTSQPMKKQILQNSFNFKYIKPLTSTNQQGGTKYVNFFNKKQQQYLPQRKTIDVFQYIKNR